MQNFPSLCTHLLQTHIFNMLFYDLRIAPYKVKHLSTKICMFSFPVRVCFAVNASDVYFCGNELLAYSQIQAFPIPCARLCSTAQRSITGTSPPSSPALSPIVCGSLPRFLRITNSHYLGCLRVKCLVLFLLILISPREQSSEHSIQKPFYAVRNVSLNYS